MTANINRSGAAGLSGEMAGTGDQGDSSRERVNVKASFFSIGTYRNSDSMMGGGWPAPPSLWNPKLGQEAMQLTLEQCARADELGFDWVSFSEHHYMPLLLEPNPIVMAAAASQVVKRATLALLGPSVGFNNPVRIAEEIAMLDSLSGGRTAVLFLRSVGFEYAAYTGNLDESRERTQEASILIERALTEPQPFGWEGRHFSYRTVSPWPGMVQEKPRFYYSGNSFESAEFAAKRRYGLACSFFPVSFLGQVVARYRERAAAAGWQPERDQFVFRGRCVIADTDKEAQAMADELSAAEGAGGAGFGALQFVGSPSTVIEKVREIFDLGFGVVDFVFPARGREHAAVLRSLELVATEVMPAMRAFDDAASASRQEASNVTR
jgi:alkanesulfonate monooxygenase SsuD/methylene tetrahydromethanopterin reductase-like flavin-dependent oxidoreductase (luciferase family)